jgi:exoribonuclease R
MTLPQIERTLDPADPRQAAFMLAVRRPGTPASYEPYRDGVVPWHAAMAATYAHATAPLRRLADRYVVQAALAIANGQPVPDVVTAAFASLPPVMAHAAAFAGQIERAVIDLAETVMLHGREGETFLAVVTDVDERGARMQLCDLPVVARISAPGIGPGDELRVRLIAAEPDHPPATFQAAPVG